MYLIVHNELWVFIEYRIRSFSEWCEGLYHPLWMEVSRSSILEVVGFTDDVTDVQGIAVVEEELHNREAQDSMGTLGQVYTWYTTIKTL